VEGKKKEKIPPFEERLLGFGVRLSGQCDFWIFFFFLPQKEMIMIYRYPHSKKLL